MTVTFTIYIMVKRRNMMAVEDTADKLTTIGMQALLACHLFETPNSISTAKRQYNNKE